MEPHEIRVSYTVNDDGVHATCICGSFDETVGHAPTLKELAAVETRHLLGVTA